MDLVSEKGKGGEGNETRKNWISRGEWKYMTIPTLEENDRR